MNKPKTNQEKEIEEEVYQRKDATHKLSCRHAIGRSGRDYWMDCIILKEMPNNRLKILVFGERNWKGYDDKKQVKYVDSFRVKPISDFEIVGDEKCKRKCK